ncbi:hypothetical protein Tco_1077313 [Tanacetum coccineum]
MAEENVPAPTRTDEYFQLDEMWFTLNADLLRSALGITPKDSAYLFVALPGGDLPWRTILTMINQCLTGKTYGGDIPRHPVLQILWGVITGINVDYAELIWEEFVQAIKNFFFDAANLKVPTKKPKPHVIPYYRFTKLIIYKEGGKKKKAPPAGKSKQPAPTKQSKPVKEKTSKPSPSKKIRKGRVMKICKGRSSYQLADKEEEDQLKPEPQVEDEEYDLQRDVEGKGKSVVSDELAAQSLLDLQKPKKKSDDTFANMVCDTSSPEDSINYAENVVEMGQTNSDTRTEILKIEEEPCEEVSNTVALEERTVELDEGQAGSDPGKTPEYQISPEHVFMEEDQAGSNPGQSHVA